jgi:DNA-binding CsgD family transcriptional regulator
MGSEVSKTSTGMSSVEILSLGGYALFFGWMFLVFYWLFCEFPPDVSIGLRDVSQLCVFVAVPLGYLVIHLLARSPSFNVFATPVKVGAGVCAVMLPVAAALLYQGAAVPFGLICVLNVLAGAAASCIRLSWLDVLSRLKVERHGRFTGLALFGGALLFVLVAFTPSFMQPLFAVVYIVPSIMLLTYATRNAPGNDERAPLESVENTWRFTREIEPSFFMFGVAFGITFVFLFNYGREAVLLGLIATLFGSLAVSIMSMADKQLSITVYQRALVIITVIACIAVPFVDQVAKIACSCVVTAAWAAFLSVSSGFIVKKCTLVHDVPLFRQAPLRLMIPALGFAVGWAVASIITVQYGTHVSAFTFMRLIVAVLLVVTIMVFFPSQAHHTADGFSSDEVKVTTTVVAGDKSETDLFEARCAAVAKLYQLSPRETEILAYLAKGRNAAYIQDALVISPHTVKSHIYNIYRKLDIHSQQKLMDFVEEFPLD